MSISLVYYSNTFADWVTTTNLVVNRLNAFDTEDYVKSAGTFTVSVPSAYTSTLDISGRTTFTSNVNFSAGSINFSNTANAIFSVNTFFNKELTSNNVVKLNNVYANGNVWFSDTSTLNFSSNTLIANLNSELLGGSNSSYYIELSNTGIRQAQSSFNQANTGVVQAQAAFAQANNAYNQANTFSLLAAQAAFSQANSSYDRANTGVVQAQAAFAQANTGVTQAQAAFAQANTGVVQAQAAFGRANSAFAQANTSNTNAANASFLSTGTVPTARLGSGTANTTTYLRGDNTWQVVTSGSGGATITNDNSTNTNYYLGMSSGTSGAWLTAYVSSSKLYFNPSTGTTYSTIFQSLSDQKEKTNISTINNATDILKQINGVEFDWKDNGNKSSGVIAQELEKILPWLVSENEGIKSVNYSGLIAYLIQSNKELSERIENLENK